MKTIWQKPRVDMAKILGNYDKNLRTIWQKNKDNIAIFLFFGKHPKVLPFCP
jgi:hypothetical protein